MRKAPKIWVTQTLPRAQESAKDFEVLNLDAVVSPLLTVVMSEEDISVPEKESCLIFTARNGVRAFAQKHNEREYKVITVGSATAELARKYGFEDVHSADGTAEDIIPLVTNMLSKTTLIRHCAGRHVRGRIVETLLREGYEARRVEYYASEPVAECDVDLADIDYVAFYSPLGAKTFASLYADKQTQHLKTLSISAATDAALNKVGVQKRLMAERPNQASILDTLRLDLKNETGQI